MKIALVSPYDYAYPGGVANHIRHLHEHFTEAGHDVRVITPSSLPEEGLDSRQVIVCGRPFSVPANGSIARIALSLRLSKRVKQVLADEQFDVIHLHEPLVPTLPITVLRFSTATNVATFHAAHDRSLPYMYTWRILKRWFRKLDGKIAVSRAAEAFVSQYFPGYYNIIPNGIDLDVFRPDLEPLPELMDGKLNILFVGRFEKRKGLRFLVRAYARIKAEMPNTRLVIVGPDGGAKAAYQKSIQRAGLEDVVFTGFVPNDILPRYYRSAHVFCAPNTGQESQGIILLEALACGTPVVATNIDGFATVITHGEEGLLVPPEDAEKLALALVHLLADAGLRERLAAQGMQTAQRYTWKRVAAQVLSYYERLHQAKLTSGPPKPRPSRLRRLTGMLPGLRSRRTATDAKP
ncbi:MAG: glycosyltransferase family 1 protein [Dehalococcoidia bacterium]|nr:glycosyltransferase family 1 protein [Dehalococcoidia bacterium]